MTLRDRRRAPSRPPAHSPLARTAIAVLLACVPLMGCQTPPRADVSAEHQALVDAIAERRAQDAARVMSEHIDGSLGAGLAQTGGQPGREAASTGS